MRRRVERLKEEILAAIEQEQYASFVDIERHLRYMGVPYKGDCAICLRVKPNVYLWANVSDEFVKAVEELMFYDRKIVPAGTTKTHYRIDGKVLPFPVYTDGEESDEERWMPIVLHRGDIYEAVKMADQVH